MDVQWETLADGYTETLKRLKVPGGWIIRWHKFAMAYDPVQGRDAPTAGAGGLTFYPDPEHTWDGNALP